MNFNEFWDLYDPEPEFFNRRNATSREWEKCAPDKQQAILDWLRKNRPPKGRNPYFFVQDFVVRQQILSFGEYYKKFGTTEEQDGWHMENPTGEKVIYVKGGN